MSNRPVYTVFANISDHTFVSRHYTLARAGKSYQAAHTGNMRRVLDQDNNDVTGEACDAANDAANRAWVRI